jgi:hypothetical protein
MSNVEISESGNFNNSNDIDDNEIGETYEDRGYSKIPLDQINLNTPPISISNDFNHSFMDNNIKSYIKVFLGFVIFVILLFIISILSGHFHYEKVEINENDAIKNQRLNKNLNAKQENNSANKTPIQSDKNQKINNNINNVDNNNKNLR